MNDLDLVRRSINRFDPHEPPRFVSIGMVAEELAALSRTVLAMGDVLNTVTQHPALEVPPLETEPRDLHGRSFEEWRRGDHIPPDELERRREVEGGPGEKRLYWTEFGKLHCAHGVILHGTKCVNCERGQFPPPSPSKSEGSGHHIPMLQRLTDALEDTYKLKAIVARSIAVDVLKILDDDPGHDVTYHVVEPTRDRTKAVDDFRRIILAIRRGE